MSKYVAFSIDNVMDPMVCIQFKGWWENQVRINNVQGNLVQCVGKYKDEIEYSFLCLTEDFDLIWDDGWVENQESVLLFSENNNQAATLRYLQEQRPDEVVGHLQYVDKQRALANPDGWSYRPDLDKYWIITVTQDELKRRAAYEAWQLLDTRPFIGVDHVRDALAKAFGFDRTKRAVDFHMNTVPDGTAFTITEKEHAAS